jgi:hypothetical protein
MTDENLIRHVWFQLSPEFHDRVIKQGQTIRALPPMGPPVIPTPESAGHPGLEKIDAMEFARGPFKTVIGKWQKVAAVVQVLT